MAKMDQMEVTGVMGRLEWSGWMEQWVQTEIWEHQHQMRERQGEWIEASLLSAC